ncbi:MAG: chromosome segregation protein SMC [Paracoccus aminovorans]|nr:chromosome segregation protein SMC [Paracoccus aminovorans]
MKIRAIELTNLRRFAGLRARIEGIGDGISVLSQPNEFGKSTFFDGLHALFFQPHRSARGGVKALQPHAGGAPEAAVEIELPEGRFRVEKRWLSRATARVLDAGGRLIAQEDEAEAWIDRLVGQGLAGPSGLLWVRQGVLGMEPEGAGAAEKSERDRGLAARRDLLSSVAGEIEMMTGGRRMDQVLARVGEALARLATATLRPKAGGEWARAVEEAAALAEARAGLEPKAARLGEALQQRARLLRELAQLSDPEAGAREAEALAAAEQALKAAESHAERSRKAEADLRLARLSAAQGAAEIDRLQRLQARLEGAEAGRDAARGALAVAEALADAAAGHEAAAVSGHEAALAVAQALAARLEQAQRARLALAARDRSESLAAEYERAERQRAALEAARAARALLKITRPLLEQAEKAQAARDRLALQDEARRVSVRLSYAGEARVLLEGVALPPEGIRLRGVTGLELPGIGRMTIDPGTAGAGDPAAELGRAEAALDKALSACAAPDLGAARAALAEAERLDGSIRQAEALLAELAPEGIAALQARLAQARAAAQEAGTEAAENPDRLQDDLRAARAAEAAALVQRREAEARHAGLREARAGQQAAVQAAGQALEAVRAEAGDPVALAARLMALVAAQPALAQAEAVAAATLEQLAAAAPDLATAQAAAARLRSVVEARRRDLAQRQSDLAGVNGSIGALADEGIEEALDELRGREATATARAARYEREVRSLARLRAALEAARGAARDAYFGPVLREIEPLLSILHPGATLRLDDASLLPVALTRDGQDETLDILSGGTREQLAVLTRLAFARLFARSGQGVPVILDDALVHSDDDRIEAMFTALHRVAQDQQIIVLTCRQRAFAPLGGARLQARIAPV